MTLIVRRPDTSTGGASPHASAAGQDAREVYDRLRKALSEIRDERHIAARSRLIDLMDDCDHEGWDGEDAMAVTVAAYVHARTFLESLPSTFPTPDVYAEPDGEIAFDWVVSRTRMFSVSFGTDRKLAYSGLIDGNSAYGTEEVSDQFPALIADYLRRLYEEA